MNRNISTVHGAVRMFRRVYGHVLLGHGRCRVDSLESLPFQRDDVMHEGMTHTCASQKTHNCQLIVPTNRSKRTNSLTSVCWFVFTFIT